MDGFHHKSGVGAFGDLEGAGDRRGAPVVGHSLGERVGPSGRELGRVRRPTCPSATGSGNGPVVGRGSTSQRRGVGKDHTGATAQLIGGVTDLVGVRRHHQVGVDRGGHASVFGGCRKGHFVAAGLDVKVRRVLLAGEGAVAKIPVVRQVAFAPFAVDVAVEFQQRSFTSWIGHHEIQLRCREHLYNRIQRSAAPCSAVYLQGNIRQSSLAPVAQVHLLLEQGAFHIPVGEAHFAAGHGDLGLKRKIHAAAHLRQRQCNHRVGPHVDRGIHACGAPCFGGHRQAKGHVACKVHGHFEAGFGRHLFAVDRPHPGRHGAVAGALVGEGHRVALATCVGGSNRGGCYAQDIGVGRVLKQAAVGVDDLQDMPCAGEDGEGGWARLAVPDGIQGGEIQDVGGQGVSGAE